MSFILGDVASLNIDQIGRAADANPVRKPAFEVMSEDASALSLQSKPFPAPDHCPGRMGATAQLRHGPAGFLIFQPDVALHILQDASPPVRRATIQL